MRVFFIKAGRIANVEFLKQTGDADRIVEARELWDARDPKAGIEAFEVWDGMRFLYRYPPEQPDGA